MATLITKLWLILTTCTLLALYASTQKFGESKIEYEWSILEFDWPSDVDRFDAIKNGSYVPERSLLAGIKVYKGDVYLTVPRWFWTSGHPVTLAKVVTVNNQTRLRPYPNWAAQKQGDCSALQYAQSMEIDPNTGYMYVIDTGRIANTLNLCPGKIVIYNLNTDTEVEVHVLSEELANSTTNFLNDIVLDYVDGSVRYAYITDNNDARLVVYDFKTRRGYTLDDQSMKQENNNASYVRTNSVDYYFPLPINGITMSADFKYVYYCAVAAFDLYQIPTATLRNGNGTDKTGLRRVGTKVSQTGGLIYGHKGHLFYGAFAHNAVYYWDICRDMAEQKLTEGEVQMKIQLLLSKDNEQMQWPDTFAFDQEGWLWLVSNRLHTFNRTTGLPNNGRPYMRVWKFYVGENGYLYQAKNIHEGQHGCSSGLPLIAAPSGHFMLILIFCGLFYL